MLIRVHIAVPDEMRSLAATLTGLSGNPTEFGGRLEVTPGSPADIYNQANGYTSRIMWSASQQLEELVALPLLADGHAKKIGAWYDAWDLAGSVRLGDNFDADPKPQSASYFDFLAAIGCIRTDSEE